MSASEDVIHVYKKVSDAKLVIPSGIAEPGDVMIEVVQRKSSSNLLRKASDSRILGEADIRFSEAIQKQKEGKEITIADAQQVDGVEEPFVFNHVGLTSAEAEDRLKKFGPNKLPEKKVSKLFIFCQQLWQPMPIMIWIAAIIEFAINNWQDGIILLFIQFANAGIGFYEITKAGDAVEQLKKSLRAKASVCRDGKWLTIDQEFVVVGDLVKLASGSAVPADCRLNEGQVDIDQAAMTGESLPVTMFKGDHAKMGSTVVRGETEATVSETGADTFLGTTAALLEAGGERFSNMQVLLIFIVSILTVISLVLCIIVLIYTAIFIPFKEALSFTIVLLVASIPLAIEIVTTTTLAVGSKEMSHEGAIVTRLAAIEDLAGMSILCSDKTGTLTLNKMVIQFEHTPVYQDGVDITKLLRWAAMAAKWKEDPRDALDTMTLNAVDMASLEHVEQLDFMPFDPIVKRTEGTVVENGKKFKTTKGAPHVILKLCMDPDVGVCNAEVASKVEDDVHSLGSRGVRSLAIAKTNDKDKWEMLGLITFLDPPRPDTKYTIEQARVFGVAVKMITGDHLLIAKETSRQLDLGDYILDASGLPMLDDDNQKPANLVRDYGDMCLAADGFSQVFPEHKYLIVECLRDLGYKTGMTGDGVNDAPALKTADVGVAVNGATDAARSAADIVLTRDGLSTIVDGIVIARRIFVRIRNFLSYRIAATLQLLIFFFIAIFWFKPEDYNPEWPVFFHMPVLLLMLITLLNDGTLIAIGYDNVVPQQTPEKWNRRVLFLTSSVLAAVALISSLLLLGMLLASHQPNSFFMKSGLGGVNYGQVTTSIYLKVSVSDFLTLFSARTGNDFFWSTAPSPILLGASSIALGMSTILAAAWPPQEVDGIETYGLGLAKPYLLTLYIWIYCIVWWWIQDVCKVLTFRVMIKYNVFGINDTGKVVLPESTLEYMRLNKEKDMSKALKGGHH